MTEEQLADIERQLEPPYWQDIIEKDDIRALIAEVRRLREFPRILPGPSWENLPEGSEPLNEAPARAARR